MMQQSAADRSHITDVKKVDLHLLGVRWARTFGMERAAQWLYRLLRR